ncbi:MAG: hypothetical protein M0Z55_09220 [Peptococcaceae bacterium]|nr:hypothetical protein [Peptococcaceae bacterium]
MIKLFADLTIVAGSGAYGLLMSRRHVKRPQQLHALHQGLSALETEINYGATPLPQALKVAAQGIDPALGSIFEQTAAQIMVQIPAGPAWENSCSKAKHELCLTEEDWRNIISFGIGLGTADRSEEVKKLKLVCTRLLALEERAAERGGKLARLWSYMGFLVGAAIALVIW